MATVCNQSTTISDGTKTGVGGFYINYSVTDGHTSATINSSGVVYARATSANTSCTARNYSSTSGWYVNGIQYLITNTSTKATSTTKDTTVTQTLASGSTSIAKTHYSQNIVVQTSFGLYTVLGETYEDGFIGKSKITHTTLGTTGTITIGPKTSYTVTYNLNGGTGNIPAQTKWYDEPLTLTTAQPTKTNYKFKGWATSLANAQVGTTYTQTTYTTNAAATFYAVWELNSYVKPSITNLTIERCTSNGTLNDEGKYAKVSFNWSVYRSNLPSYHGGSTIPYGSNTVSSAVITLNASSTQQYSLNITSELSGAASGSVSKVIGGNTYNSDSAYPGTVTITDTSGPSSSHSTTVTGTLPAQFFPMDFNGNATAVGFFMPAPTSNIGAHFGQDVHIYISDSTDTSSIDYQISTALNTLGWKSYVLETLNQTN